MTETNLTWADALAAIDVNEEPGPLLTSAVEEYGAFDPFIRPLTLPGDAEWVYSIELHKRLRKHWVKSWVCTDSRVGLACGHYHVDTQEGLKALADTIKSLISEQPPTDKEPS